MDRVPACLSPPYISLARYELPVKKRGGRGSGELTTFPNGRKTGSEYQGRYLQSGEQTDMTVDTLCNGTEGVTNAKSIDNTH